MQMRASGNEFQLGDVSVHLAQAYGFCWGVERAVQMVYEARQTYPDRRLHITNELIHNPGVNEVRSPRAWAPLGTQPCTTNMMFSTRRLAQGLHALERHR